MIVCLCDQLLSCVFFQIEISVSKPAICFILYMIMCYCFFFVSRKVWFLRFEVDLRLKSRFGKMM